jgi:hypothetical protein
VDGKSLPAPAAQPLAAYNSNPTTLLERIAEFNRNPFTYVSKAAAAKSALSRPRASYVSALDAASDTPGTTGTFYTNINNDSTYSGADPVAATCRYVVSGTASDGTTRSLSIWVADSYWGTDVSSAQVNALASRFLQSTGTSDIYHWDTNVLGEPWGSTSFSNLIPWDSKKTITILLTELNTSYTGAVTVGYFWSKDNFTTSYVGGSNERIMFYIDSKLFGNTLVTSLGETSWAETNYWPKVVFSTLAHEFQHMIQFYQKEIVAGASSSADSWIDEMCSMIMEDLVADKLGVEGPRGVSAADATAGSSGNTDGRIPEFNAASSTQLTVTGDTYYGTNALDYYATSYAFGAWLTRNYGGTELLKQIVQSNKTDSTAITGAVKTVTGKTETMQSLLEKWAAAVLLSDTTTAPAGYRYNTGAWVTSTANDVVYNLGSIDIFNYSPTLSVYDGSSTMGTGYYSSNLYYKAASQLSKSQTFSLTIPTGYALSVVLK